MKLSTVTATTAASFALFVPLLPGVSARLIRRAGDGSFGRIGTVRSVSRRGGESTEDEKRALQREDARAAFRSLWGDDTTGSLANTNSMPLEGMSIPYGLSMPNYGLSMPLPGMSMPDFGLSMPSPGMSMPYGLPMSMPLDLSMSIQVRPSPLPLPIATPVPKTGASAEDEPIVPRESPEESMQVEDEEPPTVKKPSAVTASGAAAVAAASPGMSTGALAGVIVAAVAAALVVAGLVGRKVMASSSSSASSESSSAESSSVASPTPSEMDGPPTHVDTSLPSTSP